MGSAGCISDVPPREPVDAGRRYTEDQAWAFAREQVATSAACFRGRHAYCVTGPKVIDGRIRHYLNVNHDGEIPTNERHLIELGDEVRDDYAAWMRTQGLDQVEEAIRAYYRSPDVGVLPHFGGVVVDLGVPPGKLSSKDDTITIRSRLVLDGELSTHEVLKQISKWEGRYKRQRKVVLKVDVPVGPGVFRPYEVHWFRGKKRIAIFDPADEATAWASPPMGERFVGRYLEGIRSLHTSALFACGRAAPGEMPDCRGQKLPPEASWKGLGRPQGSPHPASGDTEGGGDTGGPGDDGADTRPDKPRKGKAKAKAKARARPEERDTGHVPTL